MSYAGTVTIYTDPGAARTAAIVEVRRSCAASAGVCSCGWIATSAATAYDEETGHLYGDLKGAARKFALAGRANRGQ